MNSAQHRRLTGASRLLRLIVPLVAALGSIGVLAPSASAIGTPVVIDGFGSSTAAPSPFTRTVTALPLPDTSTTPQGTFSYGNGLATMTMNGDGNGFSGTQLDYTPTSGGSVDMTGGGNNTQVLVSFALVNQDPVTGQFPTGVTVFMSATDSHGGTAIEPSDAVGNYFAFNAAFPFAGPGGFQCTNTTCDNEGGQLDFTHITHFTITFEYPTSGSGGGSLKVEVNELWATPTGGAPPSPPSPTVSAPATAVAPRGGTVDFTVAFSDDEGAAPVTYDPPSNTGLRAQDLSVSGSAFGGVAPSVTVTGGPSSYTVAVGGMTQDGTIIVDVPAGIVDDAWGQLNVASSDDPTAAFTLAVPPTFTNIDQPSFAELTNGSFTVRTTGNPAAALSIEQGSLPSGLAFADNGDGTATISGAPDLDQVGTHTVTLKASNLAGTVTQQFTITVDQTDQAPLILTSTSGIYGSELALTTSGGSGTGAVSYSAVDGTASGCSVTGGMLETSSAGTCLVTATKASDANYNSVSSPQTTVTVGQGDQAPLAVTSTSGIYGSGLALTTSGGSGTGAVSYSAVDGTASGCSVTGGVLSVSGAGTCLVTATKAADGDYNAASSPSTTISFAKAPQSSTFTSQPPAQPQVGGSYTVAGTADSGLPVAFSVDPASGSGVCSISGAVVSFTGAGVCIIDANQPGNGNYLASAPSQQTVTVTVTPPLVVQQTGAGTSAPVSVLPSNHFVEPPRYKAQSNGSFVVSVKVPGPGRVDVMITAWKGNLVHGALNARLFRLLQPAPGRFVFARARAGATRAGTLQIPVTPNAEGRRLLARHRPDTLVRVWVTFTPTDGRSHSVGYYGVLLG